MVSECESRNTTSEDGLNLGSQTERTSTGLKDMVRKTKTSIKFNRERTYRNDPETVTLALDKVLDLGHRLTEPGRPKQLQLAVGACNGRTNSLHTDKMAGANHLDDAMNSGVGWLVC